jgi:predicted HTH domain antitoxin
MSLTLQIPSDIAQALRLPPRDQERLLLIELALTLYAQEFLSLGKARELAGVDKHEFGLLLGRRGIPRHYDEEDLGDDLEYARRQ